MDERGTVAEFFQTARCGDLRAARDNTSRRIARGLVLIPDRMQPRETSHLRLPGSQSKVAHARIEFGECYRARAHREAWEIFDSSRKASHCRRPQERIVLVDPR